MVGGRGSARELREVDQASDVLGAASESQPDLIDVHAGLDEMEDAPLDGAQIPVCVHGVRGQGRSLPVTRVRASDVQRLCVDGSDPLVGAFETIASLVDLVLGEILDDEQMANRITRLDELAVRGDDLFSFHHIHQLTRVTSLLTHGARNESSW